MSKDLKPNPFSRPMSKPKMNTTLNSKANHKLSAKVEVNFENKSKGLHIRNLHNDAYDFNVLIKSFAPLKGFVKLNAFGNASIDFSDGFAVKTLNAALLKKYYDIDFWDIPMGALCPPIPGRVDYIHYVAELLKIKDPTLNAEGVSSVESKIKMLDIGTGANGIYALLASQIYGWHCVGTDINKISLDNVANVLNKNPKLKELIVLRKQQNKEHIFEGIIKAEECFDLSVCNPPFHSSKEEAQKGSLRKVNNLNKKSGEKSSKQKLKAPTPTLNFGGLDQELWYIGGEELFLKKMISESLKFSKQIRWFTSLVSKRENIAPSIKMIRELGAADVRQIEMAQGNKITRILAWTFLKAH